MSFNFIESLKEKYENINFEILISTLIFLIIGIIFYIYRIKRSMTVLNQNQEEINNDNNNINSNNINNNLDNNNINNNNNIHNNNQNSPSLKILIQIDRNRYNFEVKLSDKIEDFIHQKLFPLTNNREVYLFYQGQILSSSQTFGFYEHRLRDDVVILCKIRENVGGRNLNNNHYSDANNLNRERERLMYDPQSVSIYNIVTHGIIFVIFCFLVFSYKNFREIFTEQTVKMVKLLAIFWAICLSNTITKVYYYRKIAY